MTALAHLSRRLFRSAGHSYKTFSIHSFSTNGTINHDQFDSEVDDDAKSDTESNTEPNARPLNFQIPLENGLDKGIYKAIIIGRAGQDPTLKRLKSGRVVSLFSVGTGGVRNNRRPLDDEDPKEYANSGNVQWHRVSVYGQRLGKLTEKKVKPGSLLYLEGNLETKIFSDPVTGLVRRVREIALRRDGRIIFLGNEDDEELPGQQDLRNVGYF